MAETTDQRVVRARRGCLFYGGITFIMLVILVIAGSFVGYRVFKRTLREYTDPAPAALPAVGMPATELQQLQDRVAAFRDTVRANKPTGPLELDSREVNALLVSNPDLRVLSDKLRVAFETNQVQARVSLPLEQVGLPAFRGRYLNGTATLKVAFADGILQIVPTQMIVKGKPLPRAYMDVLRHQNLARSLNTEGHASVAMNRLQNIKVQNGKLVIVPKTPE